VTYSVISILLTHKESNLRQYIDCRLHNEYSLKKVGLVSRGLDLVPVRLFPMSSRSSYLCNVSETAGRYQLPLESSNTVCCISLLRAQLENEYDHKPANVIQIT